MPKVLVAEDTESLRADVVRELKQSGFDVLEALDGKAGFELAKTNNDISLILTDQNMPNMTGLEFLKAVRADAKFKHLPFLMVTAEAEKENIIEAVKAGVSNYIVKPFTGQALKDKLEKIDQTLKKSKAK